MPIWEATGTNIDIAIYIYTMYLSVKCVEHVLGRKRASAKLTSKAPLFADWLTCIVVCVSVCHFFRLVEKAAVESRHCGRK